MNATKSFLILACVIVTVCATSNVRADFTFGEPQRVEPVIPDFLAFIDCFSSDGLEMYIYSARAGGQGNFDLWVLRRASPYENWGPLQNLGSAVNSPQDDTSSSVSADGLILCFSSNRSGNYDMYMATRASRDAPWGQAVSVGPQVNRSSYDGDPSISPDGLELYFDSYRGGGYGAADVWVTKRADTSEPWGTPVNLGPVVNSMYEEQSISLSPDGLLLLFADCQSCGSQVGPRPGGYGGDDIWMAKRASLGDAWQSPVNLGPVVNGPGDENLPTVSPDGHTLYFWSTRSGGSGCWQALIIPLVDFNADSKVDLVDMVMLIDAWGTNNTLYDIGPMPWGDGVVDVEDLKVFIAEWEKENQPAQP